MTASFSRVLDGAAAVEGGLRFDVPADWLQGRSLFGGLQVALALRAMRAAVPVLPLRTIQATLIAPVPAGPVVARARVLRTGKNVTHVEARLGEAETLAHVIGVFGGPRSSALDVRPSRSPRPLGDGWAMPYLEGVTPVFTRHFHVRWRRGLPPFTGDTEREHALELTLRDDGPTREDHLVAIADFIPPIGLSHLHVPAASSTLTWMMEVFVDRFDDLPLEGWLVEAQLSAARGGFTHQSVTVWAPDGRLAALSHQSMLVFG